MRFKGSGLEFRFIGFENLRIRKSPNNVSQFPSKVSYARKPNIVAHAPGWHGNVRRIAGQKNSPAPKLGCASRRRLPIADAFKLDRYLRTDRQADPLDDLFFAEIFFLRFKDLAPPAADAVERLESQNAFACCAIEQGPFTLPHFCGKVGFENHILGIHLQRIGFEFTANHRPCPAVRTVGADQIVGTNLFFRTRFQVFGSSAQPRLLFV